jgi:hypothetical protein
LNGTELAYRSKSPDRVERELAELTRRYKTFRFEAVDDILNPSYITRLCPRLEAAHTDYDIFYEVKANLSREQVRKLHAGGIRRIQPGIESFSTRVLELMKKGVTALENINLLRWALHYRVFTTYNIIWGFPGETVEDNRNQLSLLRKLSAFTAALLGWTVVDGAVQPAIRGSFQYPADGCPEKSYEYVSAAVNLDRVAYFSTTNSSRPTTHTPISSATLPDGRTPGKSRPYVQSWFSDTPRVSSALKTRGRVIGTTRRHSTTSGRKSTWPAATDRGAWSTCTLSSPCARHRILNRYSMSFARRT